MSTKLMSPRRLQGAALRVIGVLVVLVALVAGLGRWWAAQQHEVLSTTAVVDGPIAAPTSGESALAFAERQWRDLAEGSGPAAAVRLAAAGEMVTEENGAAWVGAPPQASAAATTTARAAEILAFHEAQLARLRDTLGGTGVQRLLATGDAK